MVKERLFANPRGLRRSPRAESSSCNSNPAKISSFPTTSPTSCTSKNQYTLQPLKAGAIVVAGTILGRIAPGDAKSASHMHFMVQPAGKNAPQIDPKPILDGWKLLEATAVYRAAGVDPFFGPGAKNPSIGQILLMSKDQLQNRILQDPHVRSSAAAVATSRPASRPPDPRDDRVPVRLRARPVRLRPPLRPGAARDRQLRRATRRASRQLGRDREDQQHPDQGPPGPRLDHRHHDPPPAHAPRRDEAQPDRLDDELQGPDEHARAPRPREPDPGGFTPLFGSNNKLAGQIKAILQPGQWVKLINRISQIPEPVVPIAPSKYAFKTASTASTRRRHLRGRAGERSDVAVSLQPV